MTTPTTIDRPQTGRPSTSDTTNKAPGFRAMLPNLLLTVGLPAGAYYAMHAYGASDVAALLAGTAISGATLIFEAVKTRKFDPFSAFMVGAFAVGLIGLLFTGDARFLIVKDSFHTLVVGAAFLISTVIGKPLIFLAARKMGGGGDRATEQEFDRRYATVPGMRATMKRMSAVWGVGLLAEGALRIVLAYTLPVSTMVWLSTVMLIGTIGALVVITQTMKARAQRHAG